MLSRFVKSRVVQGAASSFVALAWMSGLSLLTVPIYLKILGADEWGILAAGVSLQLLFNFVDSGFSQIVPRWMARDAANGKAVGQHFRQFALVYLVIAIASCLLLQLAAQPLAMHWFQVAPARSSELETTIRIVALQLAFQFLNSLNIGTWNGLHQQPLANLRTCIFATLKHASAMASLTMVAGQAWVYATAFALVSLIEWLFNTLTVRRSLPSLPRGPEATKFPSSAFFREVLTLSVAVAVGLATSQLDRVVLSHLVDVGEYGVYVVIANLSLAFLQLQSPLTRAFFPRLVRETTETGSVSGGTMRMLLAGNFIAAALPALVASMFTEVLIHTWLRDAHFATLGSLPLKLLLYAVALNVVYGCIYQAIVAGGHSGVVLGINVLALTAGCIVALLFGAAHGIALGGAIWLATTATQAALGLGWYVLHHRRGTISLQRF